MIHDFFTPWKHGYELIMLANNLEMKCKMNMCRRQKYIFYLFFALLTSSAMFAQTVDPDLRREINEIKQTQQTIQDDLTEIKSLLSKLLTSPTPTPKPSQQKPSPQQPPTQVNIKGIEFETRVGRISCIYASVPWYPTSDKTLVCQLFQLENPARQAQNLILLLNHVKW